MKAFDKIIGYSGIKKELEQIADILINRTAYDKLGVSTPKGLLIYGEPGVGKTLMANSLIEASKRRAFLCRKDKANGDFINEINRVFEKAMDNEPSIVFLDDMDKYSNGDERHQDTEEYVTVQTCIDNLDGKEVFVLATVNNIRNLPGSLIRAGRFDRKIEVEPPNGDEATQIISHYLENKKVSDDMDPGIIATIVQGNSCAVLENILNEAGIYAGFERKNVIDMKDFMRACIKNICGISYETIDEGSHLEVDLADRDSIVTHIIYHEAGHVVVSEVLRPESVVLVSGYHVGQAHAGFTKYNNMNSKICLKEMECQVISSLAGKAAIELKFGVVDSGAYTDIEKAFDIVEDMISRFGISGLSYYSYGYRNTESFYKRQENVIASEVERYYCKAKEILSLNREFLEGIAVEMAKKKVLIGADIVKIKKNVKFTDR